MTCTNFGVRGDFCVTSNFGLSAWLQHARWFFPVMQPNVSRNVTAAAHILLARHTLFQPSAANAPGAALGTGGRS